MSGWMRALLNGGPSRVFVPADVELFEEEMNSHDFLRAVEDSALKRFLSHTSICSFVFDESLNG